MISFQQCCLRMVSAQVYCTVQHAYQCKVAVVYCARFDPLQESCARNSIASECFTRNLLLPVLAYSTSDVINVADIETAGIELAQMDFHASYARYLLKLQYVQIFLQKGQWTYKTASSANKV